MKLSIIIIGDEILLGHVTDTNSGAIARTFEPDGWTIRSVRTVGDSAADIKASIEEALQQSDLVITTGGLGPTKDDITKDVLMQIFGGEPVKNDDVIENIRTVFERRHLPLNESTLAQAVVPSSCRVIQNRFGTAPVMVFEKEGHMLISMPGVPFETEGMLPEVKEFVHQHMGLGESPQHHFFYTSGITESALSEHLDSYESNYARFAHLAYLPVPGYICLRLDQVCPSDDSVLYDLAVDSLRKLIADYLIYESTAPKTPAEALVDILKETRLTVATAESCTGGTIASRITAIPGASEVFMGGVVSYSNEAKHNVLGVQRKLIRTAGAVSSEVVEQMAAGAARVMDAYCAMATSGIAGPGGGTPDKPVGTVWIGWHVGGDTWSKLYKLPSNRQRVIDRASTEAIITLIKYLRNNYDCEQNTL